MTIATQPGAATLLDAIGAALEVAARYQPGVEEPPAAILWTDPKEEWRPIVPMLREQGRVILTLGDYDADNLTGPTIWIKCALARELDDVDVPAEEIPIVYLPGVDRQALRAGEACSPSLQPLVELQFRGAVFCQQNGRDWSVEAMLSSDAGLGLDVARDAATRESMLAALPVLATTPAKQLCGRRLEAIDFDTLVVGDAPRDLLEWMNDPEAKEAQLRDGGKWRPFRNQCESQYDFDPETDGPLVAGERLGMRESGPWSSLWDRFRDAPGLYPGISGLLRQSKPASLAFDKEPWPDENEEAEKALRKGLAEVGSLDAGAARTRIAELEREHGVRRAWVWAKVGECSVADALEHVSRLADATAEAIGGDTPEAMADLYANGGYRADDAVLAALACVKKKDDIEAVTAAIRAVYQPWLESSAERLQKVVDEHPLPLPKDQPAIEADEGGCILFADGLRFDLGVRLAGRLEKRGLQVSRSHRWSALPSVTATAKPAVSPVASKLSGTGMPDDYAPDNESSGQSLNAPRFRKLLEEAGYQYLDKGAVGEPGEPNARAWTEIGDVDRRGHDLQAGLPSVVSDEIDRLVDRIIGLFESGWRSVRVVTDHGWLLMPGGLKKHGLPKYLTEAKWSRCATISGDSKVEVPTVPWSWNPAAQFAVAPAACCFSAGHAYAHGGVSLQECVIPEMHVQPSADAGEVRASIVDVHWRGLRCRVAVQPADTTLRVDIRTKPASAETSLAVNGQAKAVDDQGRTSLVVADDDQLGAAAVVVVLDTAGRAIAKHPVQIGGEE